jgi:hypothetical protein
MNRFTLLTMLAGVLFLASCSSLKVKTDYDKEADFSSYKTFSVVDLTVEKTNINELNERRIVKAVKNEMSQKGFSEAEQADLEVHIHAVVNSKFSATANTAYYGGGYPYYRRGFGWGATYGATTVDVNEYEEGTLIIDLVDVKGEKLVWQGVGTSILKNNPKNVEDRINKAINKIMAGFPPGQ